MKLLAFFLFLLIASNSLATECTKKRLDEPGGPMEGSSVLDQDGLNFCRHYSGGKILDCMRFYANGKRTIKFETSPIPLAIQIAAENNLTEIEEANSGAKMIDFGAQNGTCSHKAIRDRFGSNIDQNYCSEVKTVIRSITSNAIIAAPSSNFSCNLKKDENNFIKGTALLGKALRVQESITDLKSEMERVCSGANLEKIPNAPKAQQLFGFKIPDAPSRLLAYKNKIDSLLDAAKPMPTEMFYCLDFLMANQSNSIGIDQTDGKHYKSLCNKEGLHASVLTGRRPGPRGCQYLIHNSHGTSCNQYDKKWDCEDGKVWVDEDSLLKNIAGLVYVEIP